MITLSLIGSDQANVVAHAQGDNPSKPSEIGSKWMPWELGYFDGLRPGQLAVLPLMDNANESFKGQEYLSLYPLVDKNNYTTGGQDVFVEDYGKRWTTLGAFGKGAAAWKPY